MVVIDREEEFDWTKSTRQANKPRATSRVAKAGGVVKVRVAAERVVVVTAIAVEASGVEAADATAADRRFQN